MRPVALGVAVLLLCLSGVQSEEAAEAPSFTYASILKTTTSMGGQALWYEFEGSTEMDVHVVEIAPGGETGRHSHPYPVVMYVLEGTLVVELDDGTRVEYGAGDALIEDANTWINNLNPGDTPSKFVGVLIGPEGAEMVTFDEG